jgi:hypothetical protein
MDYSVYMVWLRKMCGENLANRYQRAAKDLDMFLREERGGKALEDAGLEDILAFEARFSQGAKENRCPYWFLYRLYVYLDNDQLAEEILKLNGENPVPIEIKTFRNVPLEYRKSLSTAGIKTIMDLLAAARTPAERQSLAETTGIPVEGLIEIVKLADMRRMLGMRRMEELIGIGIDTLEKLAQQDPQDILNRLRKESQKPEKIKDVDYSFLPYKAGCYPVLVEGL